MWASPKQRGARHSKPGRRHTMHSHKKKDGNCPGEAISKTDGGEQICVIHNITNLTVNTAEPNSIPNSDLLRKTPAEETNCS